MEIFKVFKFDAAHRLPNVRQGHKCSKLHGHSFRVEIQIHKYLNDIDGLDNPTSENIAKWIWKHLRLALPQLSKIVVQESTESGCIYTGEE
jgi:6-pyruvoyltetrahydropterin/6-carboxytetrahydropterin synthase